MKSTTAFFLAGTLILLGAAMRFLPHPPNVSPIAAIALFSGAYLKRWYAFAVPIGAMVVSDAVIGFHSLIWATWGSFAFVGLIGLWVRRQRSLRRVVLGSLTASVLFSLITNWAVWAFTPLYPKTASGLMVCFIAAVPFFRNTLVGDLLYTGAFFGLYETVRILLLKRMEKVTVTIHDETTR